MVKEKGRRVSIDIPRIACMMEIVGLHVTDCQGSVTRCGKSII